MNKLKRIKESTNLRSNEMYQRRKSLFIFKAISQDSGYTWVVLTVAFISVALVNGMIMTVGILFEKAIEHTEMTNIQASICMALQSAMYYYSGPVVCAITNTYGFRIPAIFGGLFAATGLFLASFSDKFFELIITYGLMTGIGFGMIYSPTILIVPIYFHKYTSIATGIIISGTGFGITIVSVLHRYILFDVHWKDVMIAQSCISLILGFLAILYRPIQKTQIQKAKSIFYDLSILFDRKTYNNRSFRLFLFGTFFFSLGIKTTYWFITQRAKLYGINEKYVWLFLPIAGISNTFFKITVSILYYLYRFEPAWMTFSACFLCGLLNILSGFGGQNNIFFATALAIVHGGGASFFFALRGVMVSKYFTLKSFQTSYGYHMIVCGTGQLFGQLISGVLLYLTDGYDIAFIYGGSCILVSSIIFWLLPIIIEIDKRRK